jgi:hypothetical protein
LFNPDVIYEDVIARFAERERHGRADAGTRPGDERLLPLQPQRKRL